MHTVGILVLKKSSDNGKIGESVTSSRLIHALGMGRFKGIPRVKMQFYEMPHQEMICEELLTEGSGTSLIAGSCGEKIAELGVTAISVNAINATDGWVLFELRR